MGTEKRRERTFSFLARSSIFGILLFLFLAKIVKTCGKRRKTIKKRLERSRKRLWGLSCPFQILEFGEIPVFVPFKTHFCPFQTRSWPFLYCSSIISRYVPLVAQPLDHLGPSLVYGLVGGLYSWLGDARGQFAQYFFSLVWGQVKRCY